MKISNKMNLFFRKQKLSSEINCFFGNWQQCARWAEKNVLFCNVRPKSNARAHLKQSKNPLRPCIIDFLTSIMIYTY